MNDGQNFHLIIEAKRGWVLPGSEQFTNHSLRSDFKKAAVPNKAIVSMSDCSLEYYKANQPFDEVNDIPVKHLPWRRIHELASASRIDSNNE